MRLPTAFQTVIQQTRKVVKRSLRAASRFATEESGVVGVLWRRCVVVFVVFCVTAAITSVSVSAHDSVSGHTPSQQAYEVEVEKTREVPVYGTVYKRVPVTKTREVPVYGMVQKQVPVVKTREVPVYKWVTEDVFRDSIERVAVLRTREVPTYRYITRKKRVAPFSEQYTYQPPCSVLPGYGRYCPPSQTKTRAVFNYRYLPVRIQVGTKTETYTAYEIRPVKEKIGTRKVYKKTGTRTQTYTVYETRTVRVQTGTKTETYTAYEKRAVRGKTGTRTQTYTTTETRYRSICPTGHILKNNKCEHPTPPPNKPKCVKGQEPKGQHSHTRLGQTLCHADHSCPANTYAKPLPENPTVALINGSYQFVTPEMEKQGRGKHSEPAHWKLVDSVHKCYQAVSIFADRKPGSILTPLKKIKSLKKIVINGVEHIVNAGKITINGITYTITEGRKVVIAGVEHTIDAAGKLIPNWSGVLNSALSAISTTAKTSVKAYKLTNNVLEVVLCAPLVGTAASIAASAFAGAVTANAAVGVVTGLIVNTAINNACGKPTIVHDLVIAIYFIFGQEDRLKFKSHRIDENSKKITLKVCGPTEGLALTSVLTDIAAQLTKTPWVDLAGYTISTTHEISCEVIDTTPQPTATPKLTLTPLPTATQTPIQEPRPSWAKSGPYTTFRACHKSSVKAVKCGSDDNKNWYVYEWVN